MKKLALAVAASLAMSASADDFLVGVEFHRTSDKLTADTSGGLKIDTKNSRGGFGLKIASDVDENVRIYGLFDFDLSKTKEDNSQDYKKVEYSNIKLLFGVDFAPKITDNFKLLVGPYAGISHLDLDAESGRMCSHGYYFYQFYQTQLEVKTIGGLFGLKLGGELSNDVFAFEFGLKTDWTSYINPEKGNADFKNAKHTNIGPYIGISRKF